MVRRCALKATIKASLLVLAISSLDAQVPPERSVAINFVAEVNSNNVNGLLRIVTEQVKIGTKKITILISSPGGDTTSAFAAYNLLRNTQGAEITTFNIGSVDSAAMLLYCSGKNRYSLPGTRFLIHGNRLNTQVPTQFDAPAMDSQLQQLVNLNQMVARVVSSVAPTKEKEIAAAIQGQQILTPEQAKQWGIVQEIRTEFIQPGMNIIAFASEPTKSAEKPSPDSVFSSISSITPVTKP
jgi:ATP-dependent protease ClpP protease subunit